MGVPDHLTCDTYMQIKKTTVRTTHRITDWFQTWKRVWQVLAPRLLSLYVEYIMQNARLDDFQAGIKIAREILATSDIQMIPC